MKQVRLVKLELTNYRNIAHEIFMFDGANAKIVGENRIGKTNTLEAIYFLFTNYLLDGSADLTGIKPLTDTKKEVKVEGTFEVDDVENNKSLMITLSKTYGENWVKKRGTDEVVLQGHYEEYFVNGNKQSKEKDYNKVIEEEFGVVASDSNEINQMQMLINPFYLGNIGDGTKWTMLRNFVIKIIGDVTDDEVFIKTPSTAVIKQDLTNALGKTEQLKKKYHDDMSTLKEEIAGYDSQISLLEKTECPKDSDVLIAKKQIEELDTQINDIKSNSGKDSVLEKLEQEKTTLDKTILDKNQQEYKAFSSQPNKAGEHDVKVAELNNKIDAKTSELSDVLDKKGTIKSDVKYKTASKDNLAKDYLEVVNKIKNVDNAITTVCPTCNRPLEEEEIAKARETLLSQYEAQKSEITRKGTTLKKEIEELNKNLSEVAHEETKIRSELETLREEFKTLNNEIVDRPIFKESDELVGLRKKLDEVKDKINERKTANNQTATSNYEKIKELEKTKETYQVVVDNKAYYERQMNLLETVKNEKSGVVKTLTTVEQKNEALQTFIYTKLKLLDEHVSKVFGKIRFQLVKENINGGFDPVCKPYIYDVDNDCSTDVLWKNGSKSERVITGIAIVETIRNKLNLSQLPFLFDEGGEISKETFRSKFKTKAQIICVRVEDNIVKPIISKF